MNSEKSYRFHFLTILSGNTVSQLIPFLIAPFLTRVFTKEEFGVSASWLSIVTLLGIVSTGRLEMAIPLPKSNLESRQIFASGLIITVGITLLSCILVVFSDQFAHWYNDPELARYIWLIPLGVLSVGLLGLINNFSLRNRQYQRVSFGKIVQSLVNNLVALALGYWAFGVLGILIAWIISQYVNTAILFDRKRIRSVFNPKLYSRTILKKVVTKYKEFPLINSLHAFTDIFATQFILFFLITVHFSKETLGLFYLMHRYVRAPMVLVSSSVSQLYYVEASKAIQNNESGLPMALRTLKTTAIFAVPFLLVLVFFAPIIFEWYLGAAWRDAGVYAQYLAPMFFFNFFVSPLSGTPLIFNKQKTAFVFSIAGYSLTLGSILVGAFLNWDFKQTLILYSISFSLYYLALILWYFSLLRK